MAEQEQTPDVLDAADEVVTAEVSEEIAVEDQPAEAAPSTPSVPDFSAGDTLRLGVRITEGEKTRIQYFEGIVLARRGAGVSQSFTIRKIGAGGIAVERIFPLFSPSLASIDVRRRGITRRAKVYFLRDVVGSTANVIKERKVTRDLSVVRAARAEKKSAKQARKAETTKPAAQESQSRSARRAARKNS